MGDTWGDTSASLTYKNQEYMNKCCGVPSRPSGPQGCTSVQVVTAVDSSLNVVQVSCVPKESWMRTAMYGGNSSQAYLNYQIQQFAQNCAYVNTLPAVPDTPNFAASLAGIDYNKYATPQSRFAMYIRPDPAATACQPPSTAELNATMPKTIIQQYCTNVVGIIPAPSS